MMKNRVLRCATLLGVAFLMVASMSGCSQVKEAKAKEITYSPEFVYKVPSEAELCEEYMESVGYEYEDTLMLDLIDRFDGEVCIDDTADITLEDLENRNGKVIVERCFGVVTSPELDGAIMNTPEDEGDYISYRGYTGSETLREGTLMVTYLVYNPENSYFDDIMERYDCVVSHELED